MKLGGTAAAPTAAHADNSILYDDTLMGPAAAACLSCHKSSDAVKSGWLTNHLNGGGFTPAVLPGGRSAVLSGTVKENCAACHQ